jgi:hypothetical protein
VAMQEGHTPMEERPCFRAGVESLLELFTSLIPHPTHKSKRNRFMGEVGGKGIKPHKADQRESMPWNFLWMVEQGRSAPIGAAPHPPTHPQPLQPPSHTSHFKLCGRLWGCAGHHQASPSGCGGLDPPALFPLHRGKVDGGWAPAQDLRGGGGG